MEFSPTRRKVLRDATMGIGIGLCAPGTLLSASFLWSTGYDPASIESAPVAGQGETCHPHLHQL